MELLPALAQNEVGPAADGLHAPGRPLLQDLPHPHDPGHAGDEDVEVAGEGVPQGGHAEEPGHELVRVGAPLQVHGELEAAQVGLIPHVGDLLHLAALHQLGDLVHNGLHGGGVGDLVDLDEVFFLHVPPPGLDLEGAAARLIDGAELPLVVEELAAGGKVGGLQGGHQVAVGVFEVGGGGVAHLGQVKAADVGGHAHGDAHIGGHQHVGEGGGQEGGLFHGAVVVGHEVHGVLVDVPEKLGADGV